jgi:hypothetical protein
MTVDEDQNIERVRLADAGDYPPGRMLELSTHVPTTGETFKDAFDITERVLGEKIAQGSLFAYLFRRFGFPNRGSDPERDLASYMLTTTLPDMLLRITPYSGGNTSISFMFMVPSEVLARCDDWLQRDRDAHQTSFFDWIESEGRVPDWADRVAGQMEREGWPTGRADTGWRRMMPGLAMLSYGADAEDDHADLLTVKNWYRAIVSDYEAVRPLPPVQWRGADVDAWDDEDPMKPYALAMAETLNDLKRPVWIRDCAIWIHGAIDEADQPEDLGPDADAAASAGFPSGVLGNHDPEAFSRLHGAVQELDEDPVVAMTRAAEILEAWKARAVIDADATEEPTVARGETVWTPRTDAEEGLTPGLLDGHAERIFTHGGCDALAIAIHDAMGWPLIAITDAHNVHDGKAGGGSAMHWGVQHPSLLFIDVDGRHDVEDVVRSYDGDADEGRAAWGLSTREDAMEWWNEAGRKVSLETAALFAEAVVDRFHEQLAAPKEGEQA